MACILVLILLPVVTDNRVQWLRSKARYERWDEEYRLARAEMTWIPRGYQYRGNIWRQRSNGLSGGHDAYAARQGALWDSMAIHAYERFIQVLPNVQISEE